MSSDEILIDVRGLSKRYEIYGEPRDRLKQLVLPRIHRVLNRVGVALHLWRPSTPRGYFREFWALKDISFQVRRGETLGIIGRNGGGKSTLLQILAGTLTQTSGEVDVVGRIAALLELGSGFNPEFTGRENVFMNGRILGLGQKEIEARYDQIVEFADIGEFIDEPVKTYSSGMFVRLAFAVQAHVDASIVIIDEALAVGDVFFRQKCYTRLEQLRKSGAAILLVSHAMADIEQYCERAIVLDHGVMKYIGPATEATKRYYLLHQTVSRPIAIKDVLPALAGAPTTGEPSRPMDRAPSDAYIDLSKKSQVSTGQAYCTGVALCNAAGEACNSFRQGDVAVFFYEFELNEHIGVPICGILISNDRGIIVCGKNGWQYDDDVPLSLGTGSKVICRQEIKLDIAPGDYVFEVGLVAVSPTEWKNRAHISHDETALYHLRVCHIANAGSFSVGLALKDGVLVLTHHGVANLEGRINTMVCAGEGEFRG